GTLNLKTKNGARLFLDIGRGGTTALSNGIVAQIRPIANDGVNDIPHPGGLSPLLSSIAAATSTTVSSDSAAAQNALNVTSVTGFAADDIICIQDAGGGVTRLEWHRVSKTAAGILTLDRNLIFAHTAAQADTVRNKADSFVPIYLPGGASYEVVIDYG